MVRAVYGGSRPGPDHGLAVPALVPPGQVRHRPLLGPLGPGREPARRPGGRHGRARTRTRGRTRPARRRGRRPGRRPAAPGRPGGPAPHTRRLPPGTPRCRWPPPVSGPPWPPGGPCRRTRRPGTGRTSTSAATSRRTFSSSDRTPSQTMSDESGWSRRSASDRGPSPAIHSTGRPVRLPLPGTRPSRAKASTRTCSPFRSSWRPRNRMVGRSVGHGSTSPYRSSSMPLNPTSYVPPRACEAVARAASETAVRTARRPASRRATGPSTV